MQQSQSKQSQSKIRVFIAGIVFTTCFWLSIAIVVIKQNPNIIPKEPTQIGPYLLPVSEELAKFYKAKHVNILAGDKKGSGCEYKPGVFLTAFHNVSEAIHNRDIIYVNNSPARLLTHSRTENDIAILTTNLHENKKSAKLASHEFKINDPLIILGSPGDQKALVESGIVVNEFVNDQYGSLKMYSKKVVSLYFESGISGGCVYPYGSDTPVAIVIKKESDKDHKLGEISLASKTIDDESDQD